MVCLCPLPLWMGWALSQSQEVVGIVLVHQAKLAAAVVADSLQVNPLAHK